MDDGVSGARRVEHQREQAPTSDHDRGRRMEGGIRWTENASTEAGNHKGERWTEKACSLGTIARKPHLEDDVDAVARKNWI